MHGLAIKKEAVKLRKDGKTFSEIFSILEIPKSTLSSWLSKVELSREAKSKLLHKQTQAVDEGLKAALSAKKRKREDYFKNIEERVSYLGKYAKDPNVSKLLLAILYICEGSKSYRANVMFGNSNPDIIKLFLNLLRSSYSIDERKFRCTVQCRADQNTGRLEAFWRNVTKIPKSQFYGSRIDHRTVGVRSRNKDYKGVCRIDYFSAELHNELIKIAEVLFKGL